MGKESAINDELNRIQAGDNISRKAYQTVISRARAFLEQNPDCLIAKFAYFNALDSCRIHTNQDHCSEDLNNLEEDKKITELIEFMTSHIEALDKTDRVTTDTEIKAIVVRQERQVNSQALTVPILEKKRSYYQAHLDWQQKELIRSHKFVGLTATGGIALAAGIPQLIAGAVLLSLDSNTADCGKLPPFMDCVYQVDRPVAIGLAIAGGVLTAAGLVMVPLGYLGYHKPKPRPQRE